LPVLGDLREDRAVNVIKVDKKTTSGEWPAIGKMLSLSRESVFYLEGLK
jgi:hypothetical protein